MNNLAIIKQSFIMSLQNIRANKMRSFLTMLGIVIGVGSVIGLVTIVHIVTGAVMGNLSGLGAGKLTIYGYVSATKMGLTENDVKQLSAIDGVLGVAPVASQSATIVVDKEEYKKIRLRGVSDIYFRQNPDTVTSGRGFTESDMNGNTNICIVEESFIKKALLGKQVLGGKILIRGVEYTIVGIAKNDESLLSYMTSANALEGAVLVPFKNVLSMEGKKIIYNAEVYVKEGYDIGMVESSLRSALSNMYNGDKDSFDVINLQSLNTMMDQVKGLLSALMGGIASISLLVGGIGIMNMMLVSVSERTKEIGLRKALGAEPSRIQLQFLIEAVVLSGMGGLIGIGLGLGIALIASAIMKADFVISFSAIAMGVGFSAAVGIVFGWVPAKRASELNPIDALRAD